MSERFSREEVGAILREAIEERDAQHALERDGVSLDELVRVAEEVGLAEGDIRAAAERVRATRKQEKFHLFGAPASLRIEIVTNKRSVIGVRGESARGRFGWHG